MKFDKFRALPIEEKVRVELSELALRLNNLKWYEFKKRREIMFYISVIESVYNPSRIKFI
jgi:hypothetical protein